MSKLFHESHRSLQRQFDTERLADRIEQRLFREQLAPDDRAFIERMNIFFLATADASGQPNYSYKGGDPARMIDVSHAVEHGMVTYKGPPAPLICDHLSHRASRSRYLAGAECQIDRIHMVANGRTYVDSPFHRFVYGPFMSPPIVRTVAFGSPEGRKTWIPVRISECAAARVSGSS